ncbi:protein O-mannosyl-transferase TMTC4-like [Onthophagus taurus]|uniref:protein O-mannosyl-transferase TMTC4-like n=1 Tax=Onthophagus taurus TaxID=166361 RepID=UPI0039BE3AA7
MGEKKICNNMNKKVIVGGVALICYANTLFGSFVFDDTEAIVKNKDVNPKSSLIDVFKNDFWGGDISKNTSHKSYRPLTILTYRFNALLSDFNPMGFHATNILLYVILCILLIPLIQLFIFEKHLKNEISFLSTLLFTVHPVHTETVAALVGRADLLCSIFSLITILLYKKTIQKDSVILLLVISFIVFLAVLTKETAIMVLGLCSVYDIFYTRIFKNGVTKRFFFRFSWLLLTGVGIMYFRLWIMNFERPIFAPVDNPASFSNCIFTKVFTYNYIYLINLLLLIWPQWLCFDWSMGCIPLIEEPYDYRALFVITFWILIGIFLYLLYFNSNISKSSNFLAIFLLILPFIPASNVFFKVGFVIAERTLLLPSVGYCVLISLGFKKITCKFKDNKKRKLLYKYFYGICVIFGIQTILRNQQWLNEKSLFVSALQVCPLNAKVHYNIAKIAADEDDKDLALFEYRKAIELNPFYEQAMNNLANLLRENQKYKEAEVLLRKAVNIRPNFAAAWMNLGIVLTNLNQAKEAESCYLKAIQHRNKYPDCYYNLGNLYLDQHKPEEALNAWKQAVYYKPTHTSAWSNTLVLLDSLQQYEKVIDLGNTALMYNPKSPALHFSIANTLGKMRQFEKAEKHFLEAINFNPYSGLYHSNLGVLYHRWGKLEKARDMYKKAIQLDPNLKSAENNLRTLLYKSNNKIN